MNRRRYLAATGAVGMATIAGCLGGEEGNTDPAERDVSIEYRPPDRDWPRRFGDLANNGVSTASSPPRSTPDVAWEVSTESPVTSVAVVGETTLLGTFDRTVAVDRDGEGRWTVADGGTVTVVDGRRYAVDGETVRSMAVDRDEEFWAAEFDERVNDVLEVNGTVYVTAAEGLVGLHPDTGERRWVVAPDGGSSRWGYLGLGDGRLHWITRASYRRYRPNGPERPQEDAAASLSELEPQFDPGPPVIAAGRAYSGGVGPDPTGMREFSSGGVSWYRRFDSTTRSPAVLDDRLVLSSYDSSDPGETSIHALDRESKAGLWTATVPEPVNDPVVGDGTVIVGGGHPGEDDPGTIAGIDVDSGEHLWQRELHPGRAGYEVALTGERVIVGTAAGAVVLA